MKRRSSSWRGFRAVLCAVDFSEHAARALQHAAVLALRAGARLTVAYINDPLLVAAAAAGLGDRTLAASSLRELRRFTDAFIPPADRARLSVSERVSVGPAVQGILKIAKASRSDVIAMGTMGLTGARRLIIGSTTLSVLQRTTLPVLAIPPLQASADSLPSAAWPTGAIMVPLALDAASGREVEAAGAIVSWIGATMLLVHVIETPVAPGWFPSDVNAQTHMLQARAAALIGALAARARKRVGTDTRVVVGHVGDEIATLAAANRIQLVITSLHDRRSWLGASRGSISYRVLSHAVTPVLALPPHWCRR